MRDFKITVFNTIEEKKKGLLGHSKISPNEIFVFPNTKHIHTSGMKFPIKVIFTDKDFQVITSYYMKPNQKVEEYDAYYAIETYPFFNNNTINEIKKKLIKATGG
jgi:uncharacterized membrane protein (UPF0127 family)